MTLNNCSHLLTNSTCSRCFLSISDRLINFSFLEMFSNDFAVIKKRRKKACGCRNDKILTWFSKSGEARTDKKLLVVNICFTLLLFFCFVDEPVLVFQRNSFLSLVDEEKQTNYCVISRLFEEVIFNQSNALKCRFNITWFFF